MAKYKQRCVICKKNMVLMLSGRQFPICMTCEMKNFDQPIKDPKYKALLDIDKKWYEENSFLRSVKSHCLRKGMLTDRLNEAFKKVAEEYKTTGTSSKNKNEKISKTKKSSDPSADGGSE